MTIADPTPETPRLPDTPARPTPPPPSQIADALTRATRTHDPRAIAEYLVLRRHK
jgi:hypothetical protein